VPAAKRKYGYFNMPVLAGDRFVGTLDAKADRNAKNFIIRSLRLDKVTTPKRKKIHDKIGELAEFTECSAITSDELRITS
jgi:uncharacterized protein YcaQ